MYEFFSAAFPYVRRQLCNYTIANKLTVHCNQIIFDYHSSADESVFKEEILLLGKSVRWTGDADVKVEQDIKFNNILNF